MTKNKILKKILIVDDEPNVRLLVSRMLSQSYKVLEASDGQGAIDIARREHPALILMDIMMPGVDGYTACHTLKTDKATKGIPVIILTALGFELNKVLAKKMGVDAYITKPFSEQDLVTAVGQYS